ncbi:MAG: HAD family hydrolase [Rhodospirillum sp.]|nr:HAD family hydrolase [Rhodospirillum sp.]MCF8488989.1 HAD family hydrolase [Rhodospirillum sp.]
MTSSIAASTMDTGRQHAALLFDMDGTILNSIPAVERVWTAWAKGRGVPESLIRSMPHGVRAVDLIARMNLPHLDLQAEAALLLEMELADADGVIPIPGAKALLEALPPDRWAIVTSAAASLARLRISVAGLPFPKIMITGEDVTRGKPDPQGYLLAAEHLGVPIADCLVFEDAPAGLQAGEAAGASVLAITATHATPLDTLYPAIRDYRDIKVTPMAPSGPIHVQRIRPEEAMTTP